jgi:hypothetical protein
MLLTLPFLSSMKKIEFKKYQHYKKKKLSVLKIFTTIIYLLLFGLILYFVSSLD